MRLTALYCMMALGLPLRWQYGLIGKLVED